MQFLVCAAMVFILTMPVFYWLTKNFYAEDMVEVIEAIQSGKRLPPIDLEQDIIAGMMLHYILIFIGIIVAMFITLRFITRRLWSPFDDTLRKTERFNLSQGQLPVFQETDIQEFQRLNQSLEKLMRKDMETFRIQKEFTENASHELQTPLAIIRSKLDLLLQEDLNERQMQFASELEQLTMRLGRLNNNLLLLAKIENAQYADMEQADIGKMLTRMLPSYEVLHTGLPLHFENRCSTGHSKLRANVILLECLLKNLVINAIRHSPTEGKIAILLEDSTLTVANTANGNKPLAAETLFQRFQTHNPQSQGNGLGLAIVKAICDFHGWTIGYAFKDKQHLFVVHFIPLRNKQ